MEEPLVQPTEQPDHVGLYLYGVVRARRRGLERRNRDLMRVRYRDIEALARPASFELPKGNADDVQQHQKTIESVMRRSTILPAPYGIVFKDRRAVIKLLQDQYLVLDEGLSLLDGHWELRLHVSASDAGQDAVELSDEAMAVYSDLRRFARAAVPFPHEPERLMSAAFLVERTSWVEFIERIEGYGEQHKALSFDITGPWPAYDFVRIVT
jgi:hypothetical protein